MVDSFHPAHLALSLFNTLLLTWLGLTVLISAERRGWGIWLGSGALLLGALFFIAHSVLLVNISGIGLRSWGWWFLLGMAAVIGLPLAWYLIVLWYAGFWDGDSALRQQHGGWLVAIVAVMSGGLLVLLAKAFRGWPVFNAIDRLMDYSLVGIPLDAWGYLLYVILCCALALDTLRRPGRTRRMLGDLARLRARPWLIGASLALLATSLAVAAAIIWAIRNTRVGAYYILDADALRVLARFDLAILLLIAAAILLVGQATAAYELFTGYALPRRGLRTIWQRTVLVALGLSTALALLLALAIPPIYSVLLTILLAAVFMTFAGWQLFGEAEQTMHLLRPFVASDRLLDNLLAAGAEGGAESTDLQPAFDALCRDLLACDRALLIATGAFGTLVPPLTYGPVHVEPAWSTLAQQAQPTDLVMQIDPQAYDGLAFAVPLWSPRGASGVLLIGPQGGGALYTREALTIARATAERLIDTQASAAIARRLLHIQRERLVQTQLADRQTRRVLHDDVLPLLHTAMLAESSGNRSEIIALLTQAHRQIADLLRELPVTTTPDVARLGVLGALERVVSQEFRGAFDDVVWQADDSACHTLSLLPPATAEICYHAAREAIRNAARYARLPGRPLTLTIAAAADDQRLTLTIADDGRGPTTTQSDSGQGLALHSALISVVGGTLAVDSGRDAALRVTLTVPLPAASVQENHAALL